METRRWHGLTKITREIKTLGQFRPLHRSNKSGTCRSKKGPLATSPEGKICKMQNTNVPSGSSPEGFEQDRERRCLDINKVHCRIMCLLIVFKP